MARVRNNQGFRKKALDLHIRPYLEQENTQEREAYLQAREVIKPLQDETWELASKIVRRHYTESDVEKAYYLQNKFDYLYHHSIQVLLNWHYQLVSNEDLRNFPRHYHFPIFVQC